MLLFLVVYGGWAAGWMTEACRSIPRKCRVDFIFLKASRPLLTSTTREPRDLSLRVGLPESKKLTTEIVQWLRVFVIDPWPNRHGINPGPIYVGYLVGKGHWNCAVFLCLYRLHQASIPIGLSVAYTIQS
jgi:hypothetical protein